MAGLGIIDDMKAMMMLVPIEQPQQPSYYTLTLTSPPPPNYGRLHTFWLVSLQIVLHFETLLG